MHQVVEDDFESARQSVQENLVSVVKESVARGWPTKVLTQRQTAEELNDDLAIIAEECAALGMDIPVLKHSQMMQIDLNYSVVA